MLQEAAAMATTPTKKHPKSAIPQSGGKCHHCCCRKSKKSRKQCNKKFLHRSRTARYSQRVAANSATGIGVPESVQVQKHVPKACFLLSDDPHSMVGRAGASSEAPGCTSTAGYANPARSATSEIGVSGGSGKNTVLEDAIMATNPTPKHPKSAIPQLSHDCRRKIYRAQMVALYLHLDLLAVDFNAIPVYLPHLLSYIHDDIEAIDNELISLGLFDEA
ncbi:hypothetical protein CFJ40_26480, partial [Salmonella enterica]|nr:hypothetical protein [Salmonella enterica]